MKVTRSQRGIAAGVCALVVGLGWSAPARADESFVSLEDGSDLSTQAARPYAEATKARKLGQVERAYELYASAWRAQHHWQIAGALGHAEVALGRYRDAAEHLAIFLRETHDDGSIDPRDRAVTS